MTAGAPKEQPPSTRTREPRRDPIWLAVVWGKVVLGLVLAATGGVAFGHAWTREYMPFWFVGGITLMTGILLILSALYARSGAVELRTEKAPEETRTPQGEQLVPLLGALLVYKYQALTQKQLDNALQEQRKQNRRIGEILLEMEMISRSQLEEALEYQRSFSRQPKGMG